jgi:protein phosphatase
MRLVELGHLQEDDIYTHPQRNAVLRSLGDRKEPQADLFSLRLRPGDALLLCSDGQWEMTRDPLMERIIAEEADPQQASKMLVEAANQAGGEDNIAVILVRLSL